MTPSCETCGKPLVARRQNRFCSQACHNAGQKGSSRDNRWPPERVAELRRLVLEEKLFAAEVAEKLGCTKLAVIGKCRKLAIQLPGVRGDNRPIAERRSSHGAKWLLHTDPPKRDEPKPAPVSRCQFILDERVPRYPAKPTFCGQPCKAGSPYCSTHDALCRIPTRKPAEEGVVA